MLELVSHPNTRAIIEAWRRLSRGDALPGEGPVERDYPDLVGKLFILQRTSSSDLVFRVAGADLEKLIGRELADHNFLSLWRPSDKLLVSATIDAAIAENAPVLVQGAGGTLDGRQLKVEIAMAPLDARASSRPRILGLYQPLFDVGRLRGRPIWRHEATGLFPPRAERPTAPIRLVASNDI